MGLGFEQGPPFSLPHIGCSKKKKKLYKMKSEQKADVSGLTKYVAIYRKTFPGRWHSKFKILRWDCVEQETSGN